MAGPILVVLIAMVAFFLSPSYWLVGAVLVLELGCLGLVVTKVLAMLNDDEATERIDGNLAAPASRDAAVTATVPGRAPRS